MTVSEANVPQKNHRLLRLVFALVLVFAVAYVGFRLGAQAKLTVGAWLDTGLLTAAILIGAGRAILDSIPSVMEFYSHKPLIELWRPLAAVFAGFVAVGLSSPHKYHFPDAFLNLGGVQVYDRTDSGRRYLTFAVSYVDDAVDFDARSGKFEKGVVPEPNAEQFLVRLAQALSNCNENPGQVAHLQLIGFAST